MPSRPKSKAAVRPEGTPGQAPLRPPLPISRLDVDGLILDEVVEVIAAVLLDAVERQERIIRAWATEQSGDHDDREATACGGSPGTDAGAGA